MRTLESTADRQSIETRFATLTPADQRRWGRMSAHEMLCHLSDAYQLAIGEKTVSSATGFLQRTLVKWLALNTPLPWPKGLPTRPEMEQQVGGTGRHRRDLTKTARIFLPCWIASAAIAWMFQFPIRSSAA